MDPNEPDLYKNVMRLLQPETLQFRYAHPFPDKFERPPMDSLNPLAQMTVHYAFLREKLSFLPQSRHEDLVKCLNLFEDRS